MLTHKNHLNKRETPRTHLSVLMRGCANYVIKGRVLASLSKKHHPVCASRARSSNSSGGGGGDGNTVDYLHMF